MSGSKPMCLTAHAHALTTTLHPGPCAEVGVFTCRVSWVGQAKGTTLRTKVGGGAG